MCAIFSIAKMAFPVYQLYHVGMDLKQLSYFLHVADSGSFTRAASLLKIAQPALSRQVRQLEVELRQTLLLRNGRGVTLTEAGKRLLEHGRGILHQVDRAREDLEEMRGAPVGHTAIGVPPTVGRILSAPLVTEFGRRFPKATLGIVEGLSTYVTEWLASGRIDIGLLYNPAPTPPDRNPAAGRRAVVPDRPGAAAPRPRRPVYGAARRHPGHTQGLATLRAGDAEPPACGAHVCRKPSRRDRRAHQRGLGNRRYPGNSRPSGARPRLRGVVAQRDSQRPVACATAAAPDRQAAPGYVTRNRHTGAAAAHAVGKESGGTRA